MRINFAKGGNSTIIGGKRVGARATFTCCVPTRVRGPQCVWRASPACGSWPPGGRNYEALEGADNVKADAEIQGIVEVVRAKAVKGEVVAKRDYALLLFYLVSGKRRRQEVIYLRGNQLKFDDESITLRGKVKGGDNISREVTIHGCEPRRSIT